MRSPCGRCVGSVAAFSQALPSGTAACRPPVTPRLIARIFLVVGVLGLPFAALGVVVFGALAVEQPTAENALNAAVFAVLVALGLYLLAAYGQRARGRPARLPPATLWRATAAYNTVGLVASVLLYWPLAPLYLALVLLAAAAGRAEARAHDAPS